MSLRSCLAALAAALLLVPTTASAAADDRTTSASSVREDLAQVVDPAGAPGYTLALTRVKIGAGTALELHTHPGNQIAYIQRGRLTYTVSTGSVRIYRGPAGSARLVREVTSGQTGTVRAGEWVVEAPGDVHRGANRGKRPVVILLATLFPTGSPPSTPVEGR